MNDAPVQNVVWRNFSQMKIFTNSIILTVYGSACRACRKDYQTSYYGKEENAEKAKERRRRNRKTQIKKIRVYKEKNKNLVKTKSRRKKNIQEYLATVIATEELKEFRANNSNLAELPENLVPVFVTLKIAAVSNGKLNRYGISRARYGEFIASQGGLCAICKVREATSIDHDHACCDEGGGSCGECVRGILCRACNTGLGVAKDDPNILERAILLLEGKL